MPQIIQSLERGIRILDLLVERKTVRVVDVAAFLKINKSSAFRLLDTLRMKSMVEQDPVTEKYKICAGILRYSNTFIDNSLGKIIHPYLEKLTALTKENAHCCVFSGDRVIVIDQIKNLEVLNITAQIGREERMYCTSVGKVILAFLPDETKERIIGSMQLKPLTEKTITSKIVLRRHLKEIQGNGYATDNEENVKGVRCLAAPIRNHNGEVNYSIGISAPSMRLEEQKFPEYAKIVKDIAAEVSAQIGYLEASLQ